MKHTNSLPPRLVEMLPGVPRETLATVICGSVAARFDCPSSYLRVLYALILQEGEMLLQLFRRKVVDLIFIEQSRFCVGRLSWSVLGFVN